MSIRTIRTQKRRRDIFQGRQEVLFGFSMVVRARPDFLGLCIVKIKKLVSQGGSVTYVILPGRRPCSHTNLAPPGQSFARCQIKQLPRTKFIFVTPTAQCNVKC